MIKTMSLKLLEHTKLYNEVEKLIKETQQVLGEFDVTVLNELRYAHRALISCIEKLAQSPDMSPEDESFATYWRDAQKGLCIVINDAMDTVLIQTKYQLQSFRESYPNAHVIEAYGQDAFNNLCEAVIWLENQQAQTRAQRDSRVEDYKTMMQSPQYSAVLKFMRSGEQIDSVLALSERKAKREISTRFWTIFGVVIAVALAVLGLWAGKA